MIRRLRVRPVLFLLTLLIGTTAFAQTATLDGRVTDTQGGAVDGATITVGAPNDANGRTTKTEADGTFSVGGLENGPYQLRVDAPGFQSYVQPINVGGMMPTLNLVLQIAGVLENVVVAAPKLEEDLPQEVERAGTRVQTITSRQIEDGGYYDVGQALQSLVPGLFLAPRAGAFDYVAVALQGSRANEILWLVDGVRISNRLYNGVAPIDTLPAHMIERIEVLEGGQGLFYGTQAVGGVINIVTKAFTEDANGRVQTGFDTNRGGHVNLFTRNSHNGNRFVLYGSKDQARGYRNFPSSAYSASTTDRNRGYDVATFGGKYAYDFANQVRLSAMFQRSDVELDNLRPARSSATQGGGLSGSTNERTEHIFSSKLDYTPRQDVQLFFKGYYHQWDSYYNERRNSLASPGAVTVISDDEFWGYKDSGVNVLAKMTPRRGVETFAGYDFQRYSGQDDVLLIEPNSENVHGLFGQVRTTRDLTGNFTLGVGARYNAPSNSQSATVWNVSGRYDFTPTVWARANAGTAFRYPDVYELFAKDPTCCFGNPNLKPERSNNFNGSVGTRAGLVNLEVIGFYRQVTDLIVDVDDGSGETTITANRPDKVRVRGVSFVGSGAFNSVVSASLGYTYNRSQRSSNEIAGGYSSLPGIPSNQVQATFDVHPATVPAGFTLTVNKVGETFDTVSGFGQVASGDYAIVDLSGRVFLDQRRHHRINLRLENMFDNEWASGHSRNFTDGGTPFIVNVLGTPRTLHVTYSFSY